MRSPVELHIEELVLHGFSPHERFHLACAVETELTRLFTDQGIPPSFENNYHTPGLDAGNFQRPSSDNPSSEGIQIARSVYSSFSINKRTNK
jgi:hypothetical protein